MSKRYPGGVIRKTPATPTQSSASGVWNMTDVTQAQQTNNWPVANVPNPMSRSLRFRQSASAYMNRTPTVASNRRIFTISSWVKRGALGIADAGLFTAWDGTNRFYSRFEADDKLNIYFVTGGSAYDLATSMVFRDPSAWYHIVISVDTTQATNTDRVKIYVNGVQQTYTGTYVPQNTDTMWNYTVQQNIGKKDTSGSYFDGYMAEVNSVDGQALTPTSFGQYDQFGNWTSKKYTGTYGTNGFYLPFSNNSSTGTLGLDFSGNNNTWTVNNISLTPTVIRSTYTSVATTTWTAPAGVTSVDYLVVAGGGSGGVGGSTMYTSAGGGGGAGGMRTGTLTVVPGTSYTVTVGAGGAAVSSPAKNGNQGGNSVFGSITSIGGGYGALTGVGGTGGSGGGSSDYTNTNGAGTAGQGNDGGQAINSAGGGGGGAGAAGSNCTNNQGANGGAGLASSISGSSVTYAAGGGGGSYNLGGIAGGTGGTGGGGNGGSNQNNGSNASGYGSGGGGSGGTYNTTGSLTSGAGSSGIVIIAYTVNGSATYDSMTDVPTQWTPYNVTGDVGGVIRGNYATLNPLDNSGTLTNGNLTLTATSGNQASRATIQLPSSGKFYAECTLGTTTASNVGEAFGFALRTSPLTTSPNVAGEFKYVIYSDSTGAIYANGSTLTSSLGAFASGTVLQIAYDGATGNAWVGKNNTWYNSSGGTTGDPATGANPTFTSLTNVFPFVQGAAAGVNPTQYANFGQYAFTYAPPSGYKSLCTTNLPTPTIQQGNLVMDATTYTGNGSTQTITNTAGFKPDLIWNKARSFGGNNMLTDSVRGTNSQLLSDDTGAQSSLTNAVTAFNSNGFSLGSLGTVNNNTSTFVGWQWQAGQGTTSSNTSGSITSTTSVNATAGFSVVTYTGNGSAGATVGHGLGVAANMVIVKERNNANVWGVGSSSLTSWAYHLRLNSTNAESNADNFWNSTAPTSSVFSLGDVTAVNRSGGTYVAYCWSEIAGFSKFGSYTGNGSSDGPFVYTGFRPKFVLMKATTGSNDWIMYDTVRNTYNLTNLSLVPNSSAAENGVSGTTENTLDILSNGFKLRTSNALNNGSSVPYIYMAFAEYPFKSALAR